MEKYKIEQKDIVFVALSTVASIISVALTLWGGFKSGFTISYVIVFALLSVYLYSKDIKPTLFASSCGILALIASGVYAYSLNAPVGFFLFICMFFLSGIWFTSLCGKREYTSDTGLIRYIFSTYFVDTFKNMGRTFSSVFKRSEKGTALIKVLAGIGVALPCIPLIVTVLSSADAAFEGVLNEIMKNAGTTIAQIFLGIIAAPMLFTYGIAHKNSKNASSAPDREYNRIENVYVGSFLGVICFVYLVYVISQFAYFTNAFSGILPQNYTFAQYARRGFFEISIIAVINFVLIYGVMLFAKRKNGKPWGFLRGECVFVCLFTIALIASAMAKMFMYINEFGMTELRVVTSAFLIFLAVVFVLLVLRCFFSNMPVLRTSLITATCILLILGYGSVGTFVAEYNLNAFKQGKTDRIDIAMIGNQDLNGVKVLDDIAQNVKNDDLAEEARTQLRNIALSHYEYESDENMVIVSRKRKRNLGDWNYKEHEAYKVLERYAPSVGDQLDY